MKLAIVFCLVLSISCLSFAESRSRSLLSVSSSVGPIIAFSKESPDKEFYDLYPTIQTSFQTMKLSEQATDTKDYFRQIEGYSIDLLFYQRLFEGWFAGLSLYSLHTVWKDKALAGNEDTVITVLYANGGYRWTLSDGLKIGLTVRPLGHGGRFYIQPQADIGLAF